MYFTFRDGLEHASDYLGGNPENQTTRELRRAVMAANRELAAAHRWSCRYKLGSFLIYAPLTTTCSYTHSTRTFTLAASSSSWASEGTIRISEQDYPIFRRTAATTLIADPLVNPGEDIAAGTACTIYKSTQLLPVDFIALGMIYPSNTGACYISPDCQFQMTRLSGSSGTPIEFTVVADRHRPGRMSLEMSPWPSTADTVQFLYQSEARALKYTGHAARDLQGTVTVSGTTVTGTGTAFEAGMVGTIFRASNPSAGALAQVVPTDDSGDNPAYVEDIVKAVDVASQTLTLLENSNSITSAVKYVISDPIDWSTNLLNVFLRCVEKQSEIVRQREGAGKGDAFSAYNDALADAKVADRRTFDWMALGADLDARIREYRKFIPLTDV